MGTRLAFFALALLMLAGQLSLARQGMRMTPEQRAARLKDSLALTGEQAGKLITIYTESDRQREAAFTAAGDDRGARMQAMRSIMDSTDVKIESILTDTQKARYEEMKKARMQRGFQRRPRND